MYTSYSETWQFDVVAMLLALVFMPGSLSLLLGGRKWQNALGMTTIVFCSLALGIFEPYRLRSLHVTYQGIKRSVLPQPVMEELDHRRPVSEGIPLLHQEVDEEGGNAREEPNRLTILIVAQPWTGLVTAERMASLFSDTTCESREMACFSGGGRNGSLPRVIVSQDGSHKMLQKMASLGPLRGAVFTRDPRSAWPCRATKRSKQLLGEAVRVVEGGRGPAANLTIVRVEDIRRSPMEMCSALADSFGLDDDHGTAWKEACSRASEQTSSLRDAGPGIEPCWGISNTPAGDDEERHVAEALSGPLAIGLGYS